MMEQRKYIDVLRDGAFKLVFTRASNKELMISLLNGLLKGMENVVDIDFGRNEQQGDTDEQGVVSYDMLCTGVGGEVFLLEIQLQKHRHFRERTVFYGTRLINDQAPRDGMKKWGYRLKKVYVIAILDRFNIYSGPESGYWHDICLCDRGTGDIFYDGLHYIYVELSKFVLRETELVTDLEKWLYSLKHTHEMISLPLYAKEAVFRRYFNTVEYAGLTKEEKEMIDFKLKNEWDYHMVMTEKYEDGLAEGELKGELKGKLEIAKVMKAEGISVAQISKYTGLSISELENAW